MCRCARIPSAQKWTRNRQIIRKTRKTLRLSSTLIQKSYLSSGSRATLEGPPPLLHSRHARHARRCLANPQKLHSTRKSLRCFMVLVDIVAAASSAFKAHRVLGAEGRVGHAAQTLERIAGSLFLWAPGHVPLHHELRHGCRHGR